MPRIRSIKPEYWKDQELALLSRDARLFYIGLWNFADDYGRVIGDPAYLKGQIFPYDEDARVDLYIEELQSQGKIVQYVSDKGELFIHVVQLNKHQKIDTRYPSIIPQPPAPTPRKAILNEVRCNLAAKYGAAWKKKPVKVKCALCDNTGNVQFTARRWACFQYLEIDHIKPQILGGESVVENLQLLCPRCNRSKGGKFTPIPTDPPPIPADCPQQERSRSRSRRGIGGGGGGGDEPEDGVRPHPPGFASQDTGDQEAEEDPEQAPEANQTPQAEPVETGPQQAEAPAQSPEPPRSDLDLTLDAFGGFLTPSYAAKLSSILDLKRQGVSHERMRRAAVEHGDWDFYAVVKTLRNGGGKGDRGGPPPPRKDPIPSPSRAEGQKLLDDARAAVDAKLAELPADQIAEWTRQAEQEAAKLPEAMRKLCVTSALRRRAGVEFGIKGV